MYFLTILMLRFDISREFFFSMPACTYVCTCMHACMHVLLVAPVFHSLVFKIACPPLAIVLMAASRCVYPCLYHMYEYGFSVFPIC